MIGDRPSLPQLEHRPFLTDSGLKTTLIFIDGIDLPAFAAFPLLQTSDGRRRLRHYFRARAMPSSTMRRDSTRTTRSRWQRNTRR